MSPINEKKLIKGIKSVAVLEFSKGLIVLLAGFAILRLIHHDLQDLAEQIVMHLHMNPARHFPKIFIEAAGKITDSKIRLFAGFAFLYSTIRFIEAYGLWNVMVWAEWFAILSGGIYIPIEIFELIKHPTIIKALIFLINVVITLYLIYVRVFVKRTKHEVK